MRKQQYKKLIELLKDIDLELSDYLSHKDLEDVEDFEDLQELATDSGMFDQDIIYSSEAMKYLSEHDCSLQYSLELAHDMGYELDTDCIMGNSFIPKTKLGD